jgi:CMP-N-acetylneuraminic acid synthetase
MSSLEDISVIIPVREGSSRVKDKIYLPFGEKTLLEWKIAQLQEIHPSNRIFISSNSSRVGCIAEKMGVEIIVRDDFLCDGHRATFSEVITGVVGDLPTDYFAWVTVVVPLMRPDEYLEAFKLFLKNVIVEKKYDSLVTVNLFKEYIWDESGPLNYRADRNHTISQDLPDLFRVTNGLYMRSRMDTLKNGYFLGKKPFLHTVGKVSGIDIDEQEDYEIARSLISLYEN